MLCELKWLALQELPIFSQWRNQEGPNRNAGGKQAGFCICMTCEANSLCLCMIQEAALPYALLATHKRLGDALRWLQGHKACSWSE